MGEREKNANTMNFRYKILPPIYYTYPHSSTVWNTVPSQVQGVGEKNESFTQTNWILK